MKHADQNSCADKRHATFWFCVCRRKGKYGIIIFKKAKPFPVIIIVVVLLEKKISVLISIRCKQAHKTVV